MISLSLLCLDMNVNPCVWDFMLAEWDRMAACGYVNYVAFTLQVHCLRPVLGSHMPTRTGEPFLRRRSLGTYLYLQKSIITPLLLEMQLINEGSTKYDFKSV